MKKLKVIKLSKEAQKKLVGGCTTFSCTCSSGWFDRSYMWWTDPKSYNDNTAQANGK